MKKDVINHLLSRRSVLARDLKTPGPDQHQLEQILAAAHRVPDHGKIGPWRFLIFAGDSRDKFGRELAKIFFRDNPDTTEKCIDFEKERFVRAPLVIAVISSPREHKVPQWEQVLSAGAVCQNILHAARSLGFGAQWLTEWYAYHAETRRLMQLEEQEKIAGFIYIGSFDQVPTERNRPVLSERIRHWK